jgi:hypothetical protein
MRASITQFPVDTPLLQEQGRVTTMKTKILLPVVLLVIIAVLGGSLVYEIVQRHRAAKGIEQFIIAVSVQSYQGLARGDTDAVKRRLGALVTVQSEHYEQKYGHETGPEFASRLVEAKVIRDEVAATSNPSK